ncbi:hypothetical protein HF521_020810 [Silurus meridionalis]|uniref:G-protein coupled receptors family 3 profile domain-containing protein n=1 Tax=Silurus meridionalis TaxID=175797 RepID=A0A8T0BEQ5_SILME|nr:hypothetical protein HF521_020810 [Silurus meridionalis]
MLLVAVNAVHDFTMRAPAPATSAPARTSTRLVSGVEADLLSSRATEPFISHHTHSSVQVTSAMGCFASRLFWILLFAQLVALLPGSSGAPQGCGSNVSSLYYNLCDLGAVWGIVLEAFATAGVVVCLILIMVLLASIPFMSDNRRRRSVSLDAGLLLGTLGLFGLAFAFIVGKDFATCTSRRFLFGVLFAACFSCLLMKAVNFNILSRHNKAPDLGHSALEPWLFGWSK